MTRAERDPNSNLMGALGYEIRDHSVNSECRLDERGKRKKGNHFHGKSPLRKRCCDSFVKGARVEYGNRRINRLDFLSDRLWNRAQINISTQEDCEMSCPS